MAPRRTLEKRLDAQEGCSIVLFEKGSMFDRAVRSEALVRLERAGSLRKLAAELGLPESAAGALADLKHGRFNHLSNATMRELARRLDVPIPKRKDTAMVRYDPTRTTKTPAEIKEFIYGL